MSVDWPACPGHAADAAVVLALPLTRRLFWLCCARLARKGESMEFGIFMEFETRAGLSHGESFRSAFEQVDAAEAWGLDSVWLGEMHFAPTRSVLSEPIVVASAIAARTERLRLGIGVRVLPLSHPLRIAEETATLFLGEERAPRRGGSDQRGPAGLRDRAQRFAPLVRRAGCGLRREPGALPGGAGGDRGGVEG